MPDLHEVSRAARSAPPPAGAPRPSDLLLDALAVLVYARSRALISGGEDAERWYRQAVDRLSRTGFRPELARAHLLYGEWLRREGRRADARVQLRTAHEMFAAIAVVAFAMMAAGVIMLTRTAPQDLSPAKPVGSGASGRAP